jgi:hypothetical protein
MLGNHGATRMLIPYKSYSLLALKHKVIVCISVSYAPFFDALIEYYTYSDEAVFGPPMCPKIAPPAGAT